MTAHLASDTVGENIRTARKMRGLSVAQLAEKLAELGQGAERITASVIENIEHGRRRNGERTRDITVDEVTFIADVLMVSPGMLLPEMFSQPVKYDNVPDDEADVIMNMILSNMEVMKRYVEARRSHKTSAIRNPIIEIPGTGSKIQLPR